MRRGLALFIVMGISGCASKEPMPEMRKPAQVSIPHISQQEIKRWFDLAPENSTIATAVSWEEYEAIQSVVYACADYARQRYRLVQGADLFRRFKRSFSMTEPQVCRVMPKEGGLQEATLRN